MQRRRQFLLILLAAALPVLSCSRPSERPNILLIVVDALRADTLGVYGYGEATSPNLDAFASESTVFANAISVGANTTVSMAAMMTGHFPFFEEGQPPCSQSCPERWNESTWFGQHRFYAEEQIGLPRTIPTLAELVAEEGYSTAGVVTNAHLKRRYGFDRGFADFSEIYRESSPPYGLCDQVSAAALDYLGSPPESPFFLYLHYMEPHTPYVAPARFHDGRVPSDQGSPKALYRRYSGAKKRTWKEKQEIAPILRALYDAEVRNVDECIGKVLDYLEASGLGESTVVAITADHGEEFLDHGRFGHPGGFFNEHIQVPLILREPSRDPQTIDTFVRSFDLMPTILEYAGAAPPGSLDARSLEPLIEGRSRRPPGPVFSSMPFLSLRRLLQDERYKLIDWVEQPDRNQLFDIQADPREERNIISEVDAETLNRLRARMDAIVEKLEAEVRLSGKLTLESAPDAETERQLRALGYLD